MVLRWAPDYSEPMADIFDVIADRTRRDILRLLLDRSTAGDRGTSVSHIVTELGASQPTVSKHLKVLRDAHLVSVREEGPGAALPDSAAHAADVVGRAAASAKHALENALKRLPGR